jgi:aspartate kinase
VTFEKVMKFGGAALADGAGVECVCAIVRDLGGERPIVVVSAHQGVTALLDSVAQAAARGEPDGERVRIRHRSLLRQLGLDADLLDRYFAELASLLGETARRRELLLGDRDLVLSYGERMSARIVAHALKRAGVRATPVDAFDLGLTTDSNHGAARPLLESRGPIRAALRQIPGVPVVTGFLAQDRHGNLTTLGRNGSDLTAALVAEAVGARELELWKAVGGIMTADPAIVPGARVVERLSFEDAEALATHGAEILHPHALAPALRGGLTVRIRDVREPRAEGTVLDPRSGEGSNTGGPVGIAARRRLLCIHLAEIAELADIAGLAGAIARSGLEPVLCTIAGAGARVFLVPGPSVEGLLAEFANSGRRAVLERDLALAALVGGASSEPSVPSRALDALSRAGIPVVEAVVGTERASQVFVVHGADLEGAVRELHATFFAREGAHIP